MKGGTITRVTKEAGLRNRIQQVRGLLGKSVSKLHNADHAGVLLAPFDRTDIVAVQFRQFGELLLRQPLRDPEFTDSLAQ
jgi:hypothetical protein